MEKTKIADFILASLLSSYPDEGFAEDIQMLLDDGEAKLPAELRESVLNAAGDETRLNDLRSEYLSLFDSGRGVAPLYETEYGRQRALFKANELSAISGFYQAFGFELGGEGYAREMPDHLSVELEFYALLRLKEDHLRGENNSEGVEIVHSARKKFLQDHLGRFIPAILERPGVAENKNYGGILRYCDELVRTECEALGVKPEKAAWIEGERESAEISCGGAVGCLK